jgi:hypothetical protein
MASWKTPGLTAKNRVSFNVDYSELFLRPQAPKEMNGEATYTVRFLEPPTPVFVHWPQKRDPKTKKTFGFDFPDKEFSKKPNRISFCKVDDKGDIVEDPNCPWTKAGYIRQLRYYVNVIDRNENKVRILDCPSTVMEKVSKFIEAQERKNKKCDPSSWDEATYDFDIIAKRTSSNAGVEYSVVPDPSSYAALSRDDKKLISSLPINEGRAADELKLWDIAPFIKPSVVLTASSNESSDIEEEDSLEDIKRAARASNRSDDVFADPSESDEGELDLSSLDDDDIL